MINLNPILLDNRLESFLQQSKNDSSSSTSNSIETKQTPASFRLTSFSYTTSAATSSRTEATKRCWQNPETKQKRSEAAKRCWQNPQVRQKMLEAAKRRWENPETRQKRSEASKRFWENPEARQKRSETAKRHWENLEARKQISEATKRHMENLEVRQKISKAAKRRMGNPEARQKMSEAAKRRWENPEFRQKMSEAAKRRWENPQFRQKMSEIAKHHVKNSETNEKMLETSKLFYKNLEIIQLSKQRADEAIDSVLAKISPQIKVELDEELLTKEDPELQMTGSFKRFHEVNNSFPILQDPKAPDHSLLYEAEESSIDQIKISRYGDLKLSSAQKKQMLEEVKEWIRVNEKDKELYQQKLDELFEISIPIEIGPDRGRSVYAKRNIRKFEIVGPYAGILQRSEEELNRSIRKKGSCNVLSYLFATRSKYRAIDASSTGNTLSLINTGQLPGKPAWKDNNLAIIQVGKNLNFYVAKRDISQGEEVLLDYGPHYNPMHFFKVEAEDQK